MKRSLLILLMLANSALGYTQENAYISYSEETRAFHLLDSPVVGMGLYGASTPFFNQQSFGGGMDVSVRYATNLSAGFSFVATGRRINPTFGYMIGDARMTMFDVSIFHDLTLVHLNNFEAAARVSTGYTGFYLADNSIKERYWVWTEYGGYEAERALTIDKNNFFKVAPGLILRYQITREVSVEGAGLYHFYVGNANFGYRPDFNNYVLQLGVKINLY